MTETITKPSFKEVMAVTAINLNDVGLKFNTQRVGPMNFAGLRRADYGQGFRMPTMPELVQLVHASLENQDYKTTKEVVSALRNYWLTGDTGILYTQKGMYVQDKPKMENGRLSMNEKTLEKKLGKHKEKGAIFSKDKTIRFAPYGFKTQSQTPLELSANPGVVAFVGSEENAEKLAKASEHYRRNPYFWALFNVDSPQTRVANLVSNYSDVRLGVDAGYSEDEDGVSFGIKESEEK